MIIFGENIIVFGYFNSLGVLRCYGMYIYGQNLILTYVIGAPDLLFFAHISNLNCDFILIFSTPTF